MDPEELINSQCFICKTHPEIKSSKHLYIDLPKIQPQLEQWVEKANKIGQWTSNSINVTRGWIKQGLLERCITRDLKWGTKVPKEGYENKVFYVWFDAPIGYLSITHNFTDWEDWWKNPENVGVVY